MATKSVKDAQATETQTEADSSQEPQGPLWSDKSESGRVRVSLWRHERKGGKARYSVGICRSYQDEDQGWVNTFYYDDGRDLDDVIALAQEAKKKLARLKGEPESA